MATNAKTNDDAENGDVGSLGSGNEAAAGMHGAQNAGQGASTAPDSGRVGSEPLPRDREHKGGYGGEGGAPRTSSDTREPHDPS